MSTLQRGLTYIRSQGGKILSVGKNLTASTFSDTKESQIIKILEFGLFNWMRVFGVVIGIIFFLVIFTPRFSEGTFWLVFFLALLLYGFLFRNVEKRSGGIAGFFFTLTTDVIMSFFVIATDILNIIIDIVKDITEEIVELAKDLIKSLKL